MNKISNAEAFRTDIDKQIARFPEIFPAEIVNGYLMKEIRRSVKLSISIRRIKIAGTSYTILPSFVMPYMTGFVEDVEKVLFLRKFNVPFWGLAYVFGRNPMYWYRMENHIGRNSIVGTTIQKAEQLPKHVSADEKHTWILGDKCYIATTTAHGCILGASIAANAGEVALTNAYGVFKEEAKHLQPDYEPTTVNTDGWPATQKAWKNLFSTIFVICCFLHVFIKIRDRAKKKYKEIFEETATKLWDCYGALTKKSFSQRVRRLVEWGQKASLPSVILKPIEKLKANLALYASAYDFPGAHRTSNMIDRLMQRMDRHLFSTQYFHGTFSSAELNIRGWALINNFAPSNPLTVKKYGGIRSPAERLNGFCYHENWLQNLLISASLGGFRGAPPNPL
jgi:hypothetical protein